MTTLSQNIQNRVDKLPKPSNYAQAMQPLFEAVSNSLFAIDDRRKTHGYVAGEVLVTVRSLSDSDGVTLTVTDDGIGLDEERFQAFCEIDTDYKKAKGGKGVGRLFWLDAFKNVVVESMFAQGHLKKSRSFDFCLQDEEQIAERELPKHLGDLQGLGTIVSFEGLRDEDYRKWFPKREDTFLRYFSAHFISDFLVGSGPKVTVDVDGEITSYPGAISDLVKGETFDGYTEEHDEFGALRIQGFTCHEDASTGLDGVHQLHLLAHGRSVEPRKIDKLLGVLRIEREGEEDLVFHGCVSGSYLDRHVNEGRTAFTLTEKKIKELCRFCSEFIKKNFISEQISEYEDARREDYRSFVGRYPIYGFSDEDTQLERVPFGARTPEEFATGLVKFQIRRDEKRQSDIQEIMDQLEKDGEVTESFSQNLVRATQEIQASEKLALAQHVVRRKLVLELLERLIARIRKRGEKEEDFHLESTLHSLIVPMRVDGNDPSKVEASSHDLWVVDERLAFTRSFSSDRRLKDTLTTSDVETRPDLLVWNLAHGLGVVNPDELDEDVDVSQPLQKVMVVEFKRPGRDQYKKVEDQVEQQITKYLRQLKSGELETFSRQRVRIAKDCVFHCYIVADIIGDLEDQLSGWSTTANGEGRIRSLDNEFKGSTIEVVQWQDLVNDAWMRNQATLNAAGLRRGKRTLK